MLLARSQCRPVCIRESTSLSDTCPYHGSDVFGHQFGVRRATHTFSVYGDYYFVCDIQTHISTFLKCFKLKNFLTYNTIYLQIEIVRE
jgi:hypothetical protein